MLSNPLVLAGIGAAILALLGLLWARMRRKNVADTGLVETRDDDGPYEGLPPATHAAVDSEEDELLDQVAMNPTDLGARLQLLRVYHTRGDAAEFESTARALRAQLASEDQYEWQEATRLAASLLPGHPMFAKADEFPPLDASFVEPEPDYAAPPSDPLDGGLDFSAFEEQPVATAPTLAAAPPSSSTDPSFDFDFDLSEPTQAIEPVRAPAPVVVAEPVRASEPDLSFDFDLDVPSTPARGQPVLVEKTTVETFKLDLPDVDFGAMDVTQPSSPQFDMTPATPVNVDDELGDLGVFGDDAVATKLDLARAYLDMGDPDGARSMLEEVIGEGSASQQDEARKLLESLR